MKNFPNKFDIIVVGGGHAGIEAAYASAKMGLKTVLFSINADFIGNMSCNPSIGGLAKSQLVFEIDAFGGLMPLISDREGIQFRMLNNKKGPAVWSLRAQEDKIMYRTSIKQELEETENLYIKQASINDIIVEEGKFKGVVSKTGMFYEGKSCILTTGTFMRGLIHIGLTHFDAGRLGEPASYGLSDRLKKLGFTIKRFKTGTPARIDGKTIDFDEMEIQNGDDNPAHFSMRTNGFNPTQVPCYITRTNLKTHKIILDNLDKAPLYSGIIEGIGPRYCPSIEDKVVRFKDRNSHIIFVEPEGLHTNEYYINGMSTSLPLDIQIEFYHTIPGLRNAEIVRPAYAIEYDCIESTQLKKTLESKHIENLYFAGQINGTSGYEEAAAQGVVAGINAAAELLEKEPLILGRETSYMGILIDDLTSKITNEPYRMFTSRAEYRLLLRQDNADERLLKYGVKYGLIDKSYLEKVEERIRKVINTVNEFKKIMILPDKAKEILKTDSVNSSISLLDLYKRPDIDLNKIYSLTPEVDEDIKFRVYITAKYEGYIKRQLRKIKEFEHVKNIRIPADIDYEKIKIISIEAREKLSKHKPKTVGDALSISGVSPSDIESLIFWLQKLKTD